MRSPLFITVGCGHSGTGLLEARLASLSLAADVRVFREEEVSVIDALSGPKAPELFVLNAEDFAAHEYLEIGKPLRGKHHGQHNGAFGRSLGQRLAPVG